MIYDRSKKLHVNFQVLRQGSKSETVHREQFMAYVRGRVGVSNEELESVWRFLCQGNDVLSYYTFGQAIKMAEQLQEQGEIPEKRQNK